MNNLVEASEENFEELVNSRKKAVVDFYATWCGPCKKISEIFNKVAEENPDMLFIKVNVDNCENTTIRFQINSVPTLIFFENGKVIKKHNGLINYMNFKEMIAY